MTVSEQITRAKTDYDEVYKAGKLAILAESKYMHPTVSGSVIAVNDVNAIEHNLGVKVASKNLLLTIPTRKLKANFADCFYLAKGTYTVSMNFANATSWRYTITLYALDGTLVTDDVTNTTHLKSINMALNYSRGNGGIYQNADNITLNYLIFETDDDYYIGINFYFGDTTADTTVTNPQIELGTTATEYTPYVADLSSVEVSRYGKNLIQYPYIESSKTQNGVTYTDIGDGSIMISGSATNYTDFFINTIEINKNTQYCYNGFADSENIVAQVILKDVNQNTITTISANPLYQSQKVIVFNTDIYPTAVTATLLIKRDDNATVSGVIKPQLELGSTATEYEPYKEPQTATANAEGIIEGLTNLSPNMTLMSNTDGVVIDCQYYRDIDLAFENLTTAIALSGGE